VPAIVTKLTTVNQNHCVGAGLS